MIQINIALIATKIIIACVFGGFATADAGAYIDSITRDQTVIGFDGLFNGLKCFGFTFPIIAVATIHLNIPNLRRVAIERI